MSIWSQARQMAQQTPEDRNRYVDFLRAVSILVVITGHWLIAAPHYVDGTVAFDDLIALQPGIQGLTWIFQVMPIFFIVGGYANAVSLESAKRRSQGYAGWLVTRLNRLITPLLALVAVWGLAAGVSNLAGVNRDIIALASKAALIPTWFLAIYILVVVLAPLTYRIWRRWGFASFWALAGAGALVDVAFFLGDEIGGGMKWMGWSNYFWVWLAVHHLGYAWRDGRLGPPARLWLYAGAAIATMAALIIIGPYPVAMVGSPDEALSNTLPPKITLLVLGIAQFSLLLLGEKPMRRALQKVGLWAATVLINSMIMTIFLWHMTVMIIFVGVSWMAGGIGLDVEPGSGSWWAIRPLWLILLYTALLPLAIPLAILERRTLPKGAKIPSAPRLVVGALLTCLGVALIALYGFGGASVVGLGVGSFVIIALGAWASGSLARGK